ncbi:DUF1552 domain-containing protein [Thalassotalea crassostreae]|uniref:DUF1552 domain-containing protein n=1 Tax=Thalassotalea crassostreae TaxID=1763536 RepID=UPI0008380ECD|nr:DUF1552 domain-containing protein [Thalassotalea crassostreae]
MAIKSIKLNRRTFLKGLGVTCALPYLECMAGTSAQPNLAEQTAKRLCYVFIPNGVCLPHESETKYQKWHWFPKEPGANYKLNQSLSSLAPFRDKMSILGGLSHPKSRKLVGHMTADTWLTGGDIGGSAYKNTISVDQLAAKSLKKYTRYPNLALSSDGGIGFKSRVATLSFDNAGKPIPTEHRHRQIFERYFSPTGGATSTERRKSLQQNQKLVDLILQDSKRLQARLGAQDKHKMDEYLTSLNSMEEQIQRSEQWLDIPMKEFNVKDLNLDVDAAIDPEAYIRSTFDLMVLGYQIDMTRVVSYMIAREDGMGFGENFPKLALGLSKGHHKMTHDKSKGHWAEWGSYDEWLTKQFSYFVQRMSDTQDEHGSLLDNTLILYGSGTSNTHNARNYPLILAGGSNLGVNHGSYHVFDEKEPMCNLFVSMLNAVDIPTEKFGDSTGPLSAIFNQAT